MAKKALLVLACGDGHPDHDPQGHARLKAAARFFMDNTAAGHDVTIYLTCGVRLSDNHYIADAMRQQLVPLGVPVDSTIVAIHFEEGGAANTQAEVEDFLLMMALNPEVERWYCSSEYHTQRIRLYAERIDRFDGSCSSTEHCRWRDTLREFVAYWTSRLRFPYFSGPERISY